MTPSTGLSHVNQNMPPHLPPRVHRTPRTSSTIEHEVPIPSSMAIKSMTNILHRRPPPPPPLTQNEPVRLLSSPSNRTRLSRNDSKSKSTIDMQQRASSAVGLRPSTVAAVAATSTSAATATSTTNNTTKHLPLKEEHFFKRSTSADRIGRERWLHHITDSSAINNGR
jgi:hypothetical protein